MTDTFPPPTPVLQILNTRKYAMSEVLRVQALEHHNIRIPKDVVSIMLYLDKKLQKCSLEVECRLRDQSGVENSICEQMLSSNLVRGCCFIQQHRLY